MKIEQNIIDVVQLLLWTPTLNKTGVTKSGRIDGKVLGGASDDLWNRYWR